VFTLKTFRKTFATHYAKSLSIQDVAYLLGHDEIETTKGYYANTIVENVRNKMDDFDDKQDIFNN
jgi:integrase